MPTEMGSEIYRGWQPRADAPVVMMLKRAGATIIGKTTTTAFASRDPTPTLNPHNVGHTPGVSSSGSAAAVGRDGCAGRRLGPIQASTSSAASAPITRSGTKISRSLATGTAWMSPGTVNPFWRNVSSTSATGST